MERSEERPADRRTKIVATLGPASSGEAMIEKLALAGMDVARVNFSHGDRESHTLQIQAVRTVAARLGRPLAVLQDLQGPKVRLGRISQGSVELENGREVLLGPDDGGLGDREWLPVSYDRLGEQVGPGTVILIDDGRVRLRVLESDGERIRCVVEDGGTVSDRKGVNVLGATLDMEPMTPKDRDDLAFGLEQDVDYVALSFVRSAGDVHLLKEELAGAEYPPAVVAKIETADALNEIDAIIGEADAVMVARGDLGVEIPPEEVPGHQKEIIRKAVLRGREVITATQMLESMVHEPLPTRAEASDVANSVWDKTSAVMLSGETAVGAHPVGAVDIMARIVRTVEGRQEVFGPPVDRGGVVGDSGGPWASEASGTDLEPTTSEAISGAAARLAESLHASAILTPTQSGMTPRQVARFRPRIPIVATATSDRVLRRLALTWGVTPLKADPAEDTDGIIRSAMRAARSAGVVAPGDLAVVTGGVRVNIPGSTNLIMVEAVGGAGSSGEDSAQQG